VGEGDEEGALGEEVERAWEASGRRAVSGACVGGERFLERAEEAQGKRWF